MSTYRGQTTIGSIEEAVLVAVVLDNQPFSLELSPEGFGQVEVRRVRRQIHQEKASLLPVGYSFLHEFTSMNARTI